MATVSKYFSWAEQAGDVYIDFDRNLNILRHQTSRPSSLYSGASVCVRCTHTSGFTGKYNYKIVSHSNLNVWGGCGVWGYSPVVEKIYSNGSTITISDFLGMGDDHPSYTSFGQIIYYLGRSYHSIIRPNISVGDVFLFMLNLTDTSTNWTSQDSAFASLSSLTVPSATTPTTTARDVKSNADRYWNIISSAGSSYPSYNEARNKYNDIVSALGTIEARDARLLNYADKSEVNDARNRLSLNYTNQYNIGVSDYNNIKRIISKYKEQI